MRLKRVHRGLQCTSLHTQMIYYITVRRKHISSSTIKKKSCSFHLMAKVEWPREFKALQLWWRWRNRLHHFDNKHIQIQKRCKLPEAPLLTPFNEKEQFSSRLLRTVWAPLPESDIHFPRLQPSPHSFCVYPKLVTPGEGRNTNTGR